MSGFAKPFAFASVLFAGAIFGFFYAWVCSTMWGLDIIDPRAAIEAMNGMNATVRNGVFAPAFFGTPLVLLVTAALTRASGMTSASWAFAAAAALYLVGAFAVTVAVNVPMNRELLETAIPADVDAARTIWEGYSDRWQVFNILRTVVSAVVLGLAALGLYLTRRP